MKKEKGIHGKYNTLYAVMLGATASLFASLAMSVVLAIFTHNEYIDIRPNSIGCKIIAVLATILGSVLGMTLAKKKKLPVVIAICVSYILINICIAMLLFDGIGEGLGTAIIACFISILVTIIAFKPSKSLAKKRRRTTINR